MIFNKKHYFCKKLKSKMATTVIQKPTTEEVKQAIVALVRENNTEFKQLLKELLSPQPKASSKKKALPNPKVKVPYSEMPFWKANSDLQPLDLSKNALKKETFTELQTLFQDPECPPLDEWLASLN
jgi:hypothetical protein